MKNNSYVTILGWMTELNLKGNELIVYAIIYGFSQDSESYFHGSIKYLSEWTGTSSECISYILKGLVEKGLLEKISQEGKVSLYKAINPLQTNTDSIVKEQTKKKEPIKNNEFTDIVNNIVDYLNQKLGTRYRTNNSTTSKLIESKLKSGYVYDDFVKVIDTKYNDWFNNPDMSKYLRPSTLFGNKFENYLNQKSYKSSYTIPVNSNYTDSLDLDNVVNRTIIY